MDTISSNHYSTDMQACDALAYLRLTHPVEYSALARKFEHVTLPGTSCWFADAYPDLDPEYGSWLIEAIEATGLVWWEEGEPWAGEQATAELRAANRQVAVLDQQEAWHGRATGWCWPVMPAWTD